MFTPELNLLNISKVDEKMLITGIKVLLSTSALGMIFLQAGAINWGEFGLTGAIIGALFTMIYFLLKPLMQMLIKDKADDAEIKKQLAANITALEKVILAMQANHDKKLEKIEDRVAEILTEVRANNKA